MHKQSFFLMFLIFWSSVGAWAQKPATDIKNCKDHEGKQSNCNGISVGEPKVFDNRTLTLMLESLSTTLQSQQTQFIDQKTLAAALGLLQGFQSSETASALNISTLPLPGQEVQTVVKTGNVDSSGKPLPNTVQRTTDTKRESLTPQAPTLETPPTLSGFNPNYGENAADLLNDQVNLSYQIFNLRMILERSLSDRLWNEPKCPEAHPEKCGTRLQAVMGFNVTIDPPRTANDAVAVVEIAIQSGKRVSLVSLMPQEKTYNAAALSTKSNAFGGAAVVKLIQVGYNTRKRSQVFYLYRDTDTVAYERMTGDPNTLIFGWMFRPVLGRRSVSPGLRQMLAILALPDVDCTDPDEKCESTLKSHIRTYWKKYDRGTQTSFEEHDANRASVTKYYATLGLARPQIFDSRYENESDPFSTLVKATSNYQYELRPVVEGVIWRPIGAKNVIISVHGNNFFTGTQVALGDKVYASTADGLILKSTQGLDLVTTTEALANGPGTIIGRYDTSVPLTTAPKIAGVPGIEITNAAISPPIAGMRHLEIYLKEKTDKPYDKKELLLKQLPRSDSSALTIPETPVISVNGTVLDFPYQLTETKAYGFTEVFLQAYFPDSLLADGGGVVKVAWPFYSGDEWTATKRIYNPDLSFQVTRVSEKSILISRVDGAGFYNFKDDKDYVYWYCPECGEDPSVPQCWQLIAGDVPISLKTKMCKPKAEAEPTKSAQEHTKTEPSLDIESTNMVAATVEELPDNVVLVAPSGSTYTLAIPAVKAKDDKPQTVQLKQYDSVWLEISAKELSTGSSGSAKDSSSKKGASTGPDLLKVSAVEANGKRLSYVLQTGQEDTAKPDKSGTDISKSEKAKSVKSIKVEITRDLTAKPGTIDIAFLDSSNKIIGTRQVQIACTQCAEKGDK